MMKHQASLRTAIVTDVHDDRHDRTDSPGDGAPVGRHASPTGRGGVLTCAVTAMLGSSAVSAAQAAAAAPSPFARDHLRTITVTAQRRVQNLQDVPITMQALTARTLGRLDIGTFDDYVRYLPNVTDSTNGPGQGNIFMRGLSVGTGGGSQSSGTTGFFPNVAIYLDNQSGQLPSRNLDIYAADLDRIEVLEGPQGTLFGAGAEAGVIRYITNKPKLGKTEGKVHAGYGVTAHGDPNTDLSAVLNIPLINDKLALRAVIYNDSRGGYIDNVPATFKRKNTDIGIHYANYSAVNGQCPDGQPNAGYCVPPGSASINNYDITQRAINPVTYKGGRAELLYRINDDWNILVTQMYQMMDSQGVFYQQPNASDGAALHPLEVTLFNNAYDEDQFENTAWTVHGRIGVLRAIYAGGYLVRHVDQVGDYTNYARGVYGDYYQCYGPGSGGEANLASTCFSPRATWHETERNEHVQHEFRLSTPGDWRLRGIAGAFFEDDRLFDQTSWSFKSLQSCAANGSPGTPGNGGCLSNVGTLPGTSVENPGVQSSNVAFFQDTRRDVRQIAFFASLDFDLIPKVLTITVGTRHFRFDNSLRGDVTSGFGCFEQGDPAGGCLVGANNLDARNLQDTESGNKSRANVTWHVTPDAMVYFTWSQGFRPGGFNLTGGSQLIYGPQQLTATGQRLAYKQFVLPSSYRSDSLTNDEVGWKSEWFDRRLLWDGAVYQENWNDVQVGFFDPGLIGNLTVNTNGQNFRVRGLETSIRAKITRALSLQGTASWNHSVQTNSPALIDGNPSSGTFGKSITEACDSTGTHCAPIANLFGPVGGPSANSPPIQFSLRLRYQWTRAGYAWFVQAGAMHTGHSFTQAGANPSLAAGGAVSTTVLRFENPAYSSYDAAMGAAHDAWSAQVFARNLGNSHASTYTNTGQFILTQTVLRPRVIGVSFGYRF